MERFELPTLPLQGECTTNCATPAYAEDTGFEPVDHISDLLVSNQLQSTTLPIFYVRKARDSNPKYLSVLLLFKSSPSSSQMLSLCA